MFRITRSTNGKKSQNSKSRIRRSQTQRKPREKETAHAKHGRTIESISPSRYQKTTKSGYP